LTIIPKVCVLNNVFATISYSKPRVLGVHWALLIVN
jgi:hypothetical protein